MRLITKGCDRSVEAGNALNPTHRGVLDEWGHPTGKIFWEEGIRWTFAKGNKMRTLVFEGLRRTPAGKFHE